MLKKLLGQNCLATSERQRCSALGCAGHQLGPQSLGLRSSRGAILCHERHILFIPHFLFHNVDICWHFHWHLTSDGNNPGKSKGNKHSICIICIICTAGTVQVRSLAQHCAAYVHLKCQQIVSCLQVFYLKGETWAALGWTSPFLITNIDLQAKSQCFASPPVESLEVRKTLSHSVPSVRLHLCFMMCS